MRRALLTLLLACLAIAGLPAVASASSKQFTIIEDDAVFQGLTLRSQDASLAQAKSLGADAVRILVSWRRASPGSTQRTIPPGFDPGNHRSPGYDWAQYDRAVAAARRHGLKVILNPAPSIPYWGSSEPSRCPHFVAGKRKFGLGCYWKPNPRLFAKFVKAIATRYRGKVAYYSMLNEPNLENYLYPQTQKTKAGRVDLGGKLLRANWIAGYRAVAKADPKARKRVLFGETSAISSPRDTLFSALCLNRRGRPYTGALKKAQGCSKPSRLPIGGLAVHPYNQSALGSVFTKTSTRASMPMGYLSRATRVLKAAEKYKRVPKGRGIFITEFGFQSRPANVRGLSPAGQATALNQSDRLFYGDKRVRSVAQFELFDVPDRPGEDIFNSGLFQENGTPKPSVNAWRLPLVVSRLGRNRVEVWGQARPARGRTTVTIERSRSAGGPFARVRRARTNAAGYFRFTYAKRGVTRLRYRLRWSKYTSRVATAGPRIRYREKP